VHRAVTAVVGAIVTAAMVCGTLLYLERRVAPVQPEPLPPPKHGLQVMTNAILLDGSQVLELSSLSEQARVGIDAQFKANGPNDLVIAPLYAALWQRKGSTQEPRGSLRIELAAETPYRTMIEVLYTAGQSEVHKYNLLVRTAGSSRPLALDIGEPQPRQGQSAAIFLVNDGISIKFPGGNVAPGCNGLGPGLAIPKRDGYDLPAFVACFRRLNTASSPPVDQAVVVANSGVPALQVAQAANAIRCGEPSCENRQLGSPFVEYVMFGVPR
jgi:hypothetical protein